MPNTIHIPTPLRPFTDKKESIEVDGNTVGELLADLTKRYDGLRKHLYADDGRLRNFVNVYLNDEDIRYLQREQTPVKPGDSLSIVPSVAGGTPTAATPQRPTAGAATTGGESQALPELSQAEIQRYSRHLIMPEVGVDGQRQLKASSVLCIGAGGLGSPAAMYLAAAGVGRIGIVDFDVVDFSNLQRQLLHGTPDVGRSKLASAKDRLHGLNPHVDVETHETSLSSDNALELFESYDVILDGTDNSRLDIWSTTRASSAENPTPTAASSGSRARRRSSRPRVAPAIGASIQSRRRRGSCQAARRAVCWACCQASSVSSRRPKPSR